MEVRQQAEFRTFRMGQKHPCLYIDYIASDVDETIHRALKLKKKPSEKTAVVLAIIAGTLAVIEKLLEIILKLLDR